MSRCEKDLALSSPAVAHGATPFLVAPLMLVLNRIYLIQPRSCGLKAYPVSYAQQLLCVLLFGGYRWALCHLYVAAGNVLYCTPRVGLRPNHCSMNCLIPSSPPGRGSRAHALGMTLAEVVVALAIASLTIASLIGGYVFSMLAAEKSSLSLAANTRAIERLEDTHGARWNVSNLPVVDELAGTNFPGKLVVIDLSGQGAGVTYGTNYTTITDVSLSPPLRRIRVDCVWQFRSGHFSSLFTNTVEALRGPD